MQVTIDTRHDTLEEALAVIQLAFAGASVPPQASSAAPRRTGQDEHGGQEASVIQVS